MQVLKLNKSKDAEDISLNLFQNGEDINTLVVFVGGNGDDKDKFNLLIDFLYLDQFKFDILTYTYRGLSTNTSRSFDQLVQDLAEVLDFGLNALKYSKVKLICTSMGTFPVCSVLNNKKFSKVISEVLMLDPADYPLDVLDKSVNDDGNFTWTGYDNFAPTKPLCSDLLRAIEGNVKVHVLSFTIRNYSKKGYLSELKLRGVDKPDMVPRLNLDMVKGFYEKLPDKNRGEFWKDNTIPHAFVRDGDTDYNQRKLANYILFLFR